MKINKPTLIKQCLEIMDKKISTIKETMAFAQESANSETKSSAGDKYETGRAIAQMERDKAAIQLGENLKLRGFLTQIKPESKTQKIELGSIIETDNGIFFIAIGLGIVQCMDQSVIIISPVSPLGQAFINQKLGARVGFNDRSYTILKVY